MAAQLPYTFLQKPIAGKFTIGSGIVTVTCDTIKHFAEEIPEVGVLTTKSVGPGERDGNREPVIAGLTEAGKDGIVNAVGLANPGCELFLDELKDLHKNFPKDKFLLVSIFGGGTADFVKVARTLAPFRDWDVTFRQLGVHFPPNWKMR